MQKTLYIPIDTTFNYIFECPLLVKKYDTLKLKIAVFDKGVLKDITSQTINVILRKKDNTTIEKTISDKTLNIASAIFDKQATSYSGEVKGEIILADAEGQITTNTFIFNVSNSLTEDIQIKSKDSIDTLQDMRALIAAYKNEIQTIGESTQAIEALNNINTYIENNLSELTSKNSSAVKNVVDLKTENDRADINIPALKNENDNADDKLDKFRLYDTTNLIQQVQDNATQLNEIGKDTVSSLNNQPENVGCIGSIIFDDGWTEDYKILYPAIKELGIVANSAILVEGMDNGLGIYMTREMVQEISRAGWGILSHTITHKDLDTCNDSQLDTELGESKRILEELIGKSVDYVVYPRNRYSINSLKKVRQYYKGGFARYMPTDDSVDGINTLPLNQYAIYRISIELSPSIIKPLIDRCIAEKGYLVFMGHGEYYNVEKHGTNATNCMNNMKANVQYCLDNGVTFKTVDDAMEIVGNKITIGDELSGSRYFFLSKNNAIKSDEGRINVGAGLTFDSNINQFKLNKIDVREFKNSDASGFPNTSGTLLTLRPNRRLGADEISSQIWLPYNDSTSIYRRQWDNSNKKWGELRKFSSFNYEKVEVTIPVILANSTAYVDTSVSGITTSAEYISAYINIPAYNTDTLYKAYIVENGKVRIYFRSFIASNILENTVSVGIQWR